MFSTLVFMGRPDINILDILKSLLFFKQTAMSHMWYMPVIIGIYLFIPFIANALNHTEIRSMYIPLMIAFIYLFVVPVINVYLAANGIENISSLPDLSFSGGVYGFCILLGDLVRRGVFDKIPSYNIMLIGALSYVLTVYTQNYSAIHGVDYTVWYNSATLIIVALSIFILLSRTTFGSGKIAASISVNAFGIFLIHNPINLILMKLISPFSRVFR